MPEIFDFLLGIVWLPIAIVVLVILAAVFIYIRARYKIADANQALVITGGKGEPKILVGGGAFIAPLRKAQFFDLGLKTVNSTNEATHTTTMIPVVVEWTAQLRADTSKDENGELNLSLRNAILGFTNFSGNIADSLQQSLEGEVRAVIATMTPEDLVRNKVSFTEQVNTNVRDSMAELGFKLVSLNIGKITDPFGYYENLAAKDREEKRREASNLKADADQAIAVRDAETDEASKAAQQRRDLAIAEQDRTLSIRKAEIRAETGIADANAEIAGQLQTELRGQELATRQGQVEVIREQQRQAAAIARREVIVTEAETTKRKSEIEADTEARKRGIDAEAEAEVTRRRAQGEADASVRKAQGEADAINRTTEAKAKQIRETGIAEAEVTRARGEAEAASILARGTAEAETERLMADALAANEGANLKVTIAEIESRMRISQTTAMGTVMAELGKNAKFVDMGGSSNRDGDLLTKVMGNVPELFNLLGVKSDALNDASFGGSLNTLLATIKNGDTSHKDQAVEGGEGDGTSEPAQASTPEVVSGSSSEQATEPSPVTNETIQQTDQESEADRANHEKGSIS